MIKQRQQNARLGVQRRENLQFISWQVAAGMDLFKDEKKAGETGC